MVYDPRAVMGPIKFGDTFQVWPRLSAESRHRPDADVSTLRIISLATPKSDQRSIRREPQVAKLRIGDFRRAATGEIVEFSGTDLRNPDF